MKTVHVAYHKDGDSILITENPWWQPAYISMVEIALNRGVLGWLQSRSEKASDIIFSIWNKLIEFPLKFEKELFSTPIENGCAASKAIWGTHDFCWKDDCQYSDWETGDDAYRSGG